MFILFSYLITWIILFTLLFFYNSLDYYVREIWHGFGSIGPAISGVFIIVISKDKQGILELTKRLKRKPNLRIFLLSLSPVLILCVTILIEFLFGIFNPVQFITENNLTNLISWIIFFVPILSYGFFEEIGWRGYLLPKLQTKYNALKTSVILTLVWWLWHLPFFFYRFNLFYAIFLMFPLLLAGTIFITYLFNESNSLLITIVFHFSYNMVNSHEISFLAIILVSIFIIFVCIQVIKVHGIENLSKKERVKL